MKFEIYNLPKWLGVLVNEWPGTKTRSIMPSNPSLDIHCQIFCHLAIGKKHALKIYNQFTLNTQIVLLPNCAILRKKLMLHTYMM